MQLKRISNALPVPELCDNCASPNIEFTTNDKLYGRKYGDWPYLYLCSDCKAAVGCHAGTNIPLGRMTDAETRRLRVECHVEFDKLWKTGIMSRTYAYKWLAHELGIAWADCHISWLSRDQLLIAIEKVKGYHGQFEQLADRRTNRRRKRESKRRERDRKCHRTQ